MSFRLLAQFFSIASGLVLTLALAASPDAGHSDKQNLAWQTLAELEFPQNTRVAFKEARKTRLQRVEKIQYGHLLLAVDGALVMQIDSPRSELRKIQGSTLSLTRGDKVRSTTLNPQRGAHQLLLAVVQVLRGETSNLKKSFQLIKSPPEGSEKTAKDWVRLLKPKNPTLQKQMTALILRGNGQQLLSLRAERGASYQEITILAPDNSAQIADEQK